MNTQIRNLFLTLILALSFSSPAWAQSVQKQIDELNDKIKELQKAEEDKGQAIIDEVSFLKSKVLTPNLSLKSFHGMGPAASKVYYNPSRLSIGGYGEIIYKDVKGSNSVTDMKRFIPYIGYRFTDKIILNTEIEFEHAGAKDDGSEGEAVIEFAYIDFLLSQPINIRAGGILMPMGLTNTRHEPVNFNSVSRPELERKLIPSTWSENGVMLFGLAGGVDYSVAVVNGFDLTNSTLDGSSWIRDGRQGGALANANNLGYIASASYGRGTHLEVGASYYFGYGSQQLSQLNRHALNIWEGHFIYQLQGLEWRGLYASGSLSDAGALSTPTRPVGQRAGGYYTSLSYDLARLFGGDFQLPFFTRFTKYNLNQEVAEGFAANPAYDIELTTIGFNYKPIPTVTLKADYQFNQNGYNQRNNVFQMGMGFVF